MGRTFLNIDTKSSFCSVVTLRSGLDKPLYKINVSIKNCKTKEDNIALKSNNPSVIILLELKSPRKLLNIRSVVKIAE